MHTDIDHACKYLYQMFSKQVYIQIYSQEMIDQNQVPKSCKGELL